MGRKRWRLRKRDLWFLAIPAAAAVIAVVFLLWTERDVMSYTLEGSPRQYYIGNTYSVPEGAVLRRTSEGKTVLDNGGASAEISSLPIYYGDRAELTFPQDMVYYAPRLGVEARLTYFTELSVDSSGMVTARREGREQALAPGFAFDGQNVFLLLEPMVLRFNGYRIDLPAMSFVDAMGYGDIVVFNYETKEFLVEAAETAVAAESPDGAYTVSLLGDSITDRSGQRTLLHTRPELLEPLF